MSDKVQSQCKPCIALVLTCNDTTMLRQIREVSAVGANKALPDDGIVDLVAVEIVASGLRWVPLTKPERIAAAALVRAQGGSARTTATRLQVTMREAARLRRQCGPA